MSKLGGHEEHGEHGEQGKDRKHRPYDLKHSIMIQNTLFMIQNTLFMIQNTVHVNQIAQNTLFCGIFGDWLKTS